MLHRSASTHAAVAVCTALSLASANAVRADTYPDKPIRIIVPFPPGQTVDVVGRLVSEQLTSSFGKAVVVENRPGASGMVGTAIGAKAAPDGYTLLVASAGTLVGNTVMFRDKIQYNALRDFAPVINFISTPQILVVEPNSPLRSLADLIKAARASPGKLNYATPGSATSSHLAMEMLRSATGIQMLMVPYQGSPAALTDIMGGRIPVMFEAAPGVIALIRSGKVRAIANGAARRSAFLPEVPTVAEQGFPGYEASPWVGVVAPAGTPRSAIDTVYATAVKFLESAEGRTRLQNLGAEPLGMNPDQFAAHIRADIDRLTRVVQEAGIKTE